MTETCKKLRAHYSRIFDKFQELESKGLVRLLVLPDTDYDDSYIDTWDDLSHDRRERHRAEIRSRIENDGAWGLVVQTKCHCCDNWTHIDGVWGFLGSDWRESGYDYDLMEKAIQALEQVI